MIEKYCEEVGKNLISLYRHGGCFDSKLQFPKKRLKDKGKWKRRVSEQEARFMFANLLESKKKYYAVEVPTNNTYADFKDEPKVNPTHGRSGSIDMSIFSGPIIDRDMKFICDEEINYSRVNIEFKKGQPTKPAITKDLLKLFFEPSKMGVFYHILEHTDRKTVKKFLDKFNDSIEYIKKASNVTSFIKPVLLFIVILEDPKSQIRHSRCKSITFKSDIDNFKKIEEKKMKEVYSYCI